MADRPQEHVTPNNKVTTNYIEGFHGLVLKYHSKCMDLNMQIIDMHVAIKVKTTMEEIVLSPC